jgi:hypothetical protein
MPYTPDATDVAQPANTGVAASTAAAEFRALKTYIRDVILADLNTKREQGDYLFAGPASFLDQVAISTTCQTANGFNVTASGGFQAAGYIGVGLKVGSFMSVGWDTVGASVTQTGDLNTAVTIDANTGNILCFGSGTSDTHYAFVVNNPKVNANDLIVVNQIAGVVKQFDVSVTNVAAGQFTISLYCKPGFGGSGFNATLGFAILSRS